MKSILITSLIWLILTSSACAEVVFDKRDIVPNGKPGYCLFSSLETVCNKLGYSQAKGLAKSRSTGIYFRLDELRFVGKWIGYEDQVEVELRPRNIKYEIRFGGDYDYKLLERAVKGGTAGCVIGMRAGAVPTCNGPHAIILTDINKLYCKYVDTNDPDWVYKAEIGWLDFYWTGFAILINVKNTPIYHLVDTDTQGHR